MTSIESYEGYAQAALDGFYARSEESRNLLVDAVRGQSVRRVLDVGCGPGQELFPFLEKTDAVCVGIDRAEGLGSVTRRVFENHPRAVFVRADGDSLPFREQSFDVILCRVALPYMDNRAAIAEMSRVLAPGGVLLLKTHAPLFYFGMIAERLPEFSLRQLAYPVICLLGSVFHSLTGRQLMTGFFRGKEVYQTTSFIKREFGRHGLVLRGRLADDDRQTPSYVIVRER